MASYRYERDIDPKDLKPRKQRQYSRRERWANWWDYNLKWVLIFGIAGAFVAYCFIGQYFLTTHPDYNVAVVSPYYLPEATVTALQEQLAAYGEDCNGDGKVVVKLNQYTMAFNSEDSDAYLDMAGTTKLSTDIQSSLSSIFILYDPAGFQQTTGTLRYLDGHLPKSDADSDWWNMVYRWTDCPVLTGMELGSYTSDAVQSASGDSQPLSFLLKEGLFYIHPKQAFLLAGFFAGLASHQNAGEWSFSVYANNADCCVASRAQWVLERLTEILCEKVSLWFLTLLADGGTKFILPLQTHTTAVRIPDDFIVGNHTAVRIDRVEEPHREPVWLRFTLVSALSRDAKDASV